MKLPGLATPEGTRRYRDRMVEKGISPQHFREVNGLWVSSIGLGTYRGDTDAATDERYCQATLETVRRGCNFLDTAINSRHQRSERALGAALVRLAAEGIASRDEIVVGTKGGYIPFDGGMPEDPKAYFLEKFLQTDILSASDVVGGMHCMTPHYLDDQLGHSLNNLGLEAVDLYYIQNPEGQRPEVGAQEFQSRIRAAFEYLQGQVEEGRVGAYGTATWSGYRVPQDSSESLDLNELARIAGELSEESAFRYIQLPHNLAMPEAMVLATQPGPGESSVPAILATRGKRIAVVASASLKQGQLASGLPPEIGEAFPELESDAQRALQFARSTPGISVALVGMTRTEHVDENMALARIPPASREQLQRLFRPSI